MCTVCSLQCIGSDTKNIIVHKKNEAFKERNLFLFDSSPNLAEKHVPLFVFAMFAYKSAEDCGPLWVLQALSSGRDSALSPTHPKSLERAAFQLQFKSMRHSRPITALYHNSNTRSGGKEHNWQKQNINSIFKPEQRVCSDAGKKHSASGCGGHLYEYQQQGMKCWMRRS
jgi:hypothetical protein